MYSSRVDIRLGLLLTRTTVDGDFLARNETSTDNVFGSVGNILWPSSTVGGMIIDVLVHVQVLPLGALFISLFALMRDLYPSRGDEVDADATSL